MRSACRGRRPSASRRRPLAYTNHTIMAEALEKWPENMMRETLPRIYSDHAGAEPPPVRRSCATLSPASGIASATWRFWPTIRRTWRTCAWRIPTRSTAFPSSTATSSSSTTFCGLLRHHAGKVLRDHQRHYAAPLADAGQPVALPTCWMNPSVRAGARISTQLEKLLPFADDAAFVEKFAAVKKANKERFSRWIYAPSGS